MKIVWLVMVLLLLVFSLAVAQEGDNGNNEAKKLYNEGISSLKTGNTDQALKNFNAAIAADPNLAVAYYALGITYKRKRDYVTAEKNYQLAIDKDPQYVKAYTALGLLQLQLAKYVEAINTFQAALNIDPSEVKALTGIGDAYFKQRKYETALGYYETAVQSDATYAKAWDGMGTTLQELGRNVDAVDALSNALENEKKASEKDDTYLRLGNSYKALSNYNKAEEAYKNCINTTRNSNIRAAANFGLGEIYKSRGQKQTALAYFEKASQDRNWQQSALYEIDMIKNADKYTH
jgi:tetratricopeptide (TPR) repeat protein